MNTELTKPASACPGLLRIVPALDGGICRIKLAGGELNPQQAHALADAADQFANATLELTNRANIQIRAVGLPHADAMIQRLLAAGLGPDIPGLGLNSESEDLPKDFISGADDIRNLMISPAAGVDPDAIIDVRPLAQQLLAQLQRQPRFYSLSAKFALLLDGGERVAMLQHPHDLWFSAMRSAHGILFAFGLAGCPPLANALETHTQGAVTPEQVPLLMEAVLHTFLDLAQPAQTRMRHLLTALPAAAFLQAVQQRLDFPLLSTDEIRQWRRRDVAHGVPLGIFPQGEGERVQIGVTPGLGRLNTRQMRGLLALMESIEGANLRITPWQSVWLRDIPAQQAPNLLSALRELQLHTDARDPLTQIIACTGSTGCGKGLADTKHDAMRLARYLQAKNPLQQNNADWENPVPGIHLTGCQRSCAAAHVAPFTLLAVDSDRYSLFRHVDHSASVQDFGELVASSLSIEQAGKLLTELIDKPPA